MFFPDAQRKCDSELARAQARPEFLDRPEWACHLHSGDTFVASPNMARGDFTLNRGDSKSPRRTRRGIASDGGTSTDFVWLLRLGLLTASIASIFGMQRAVVEDSGNGHDSSLPILTGNVTEEPELASGRENSRFRFSAHSDLVLVPVTVTTGNGRAVP